MADDASPPSSWWDTLKGKFGFSSGEQAPPADGTAPQLGQGRRRNKKTRKQRKGRKSSKRARTGRKSTRL